MPPLSATHWARRRKRCLDANLRMHPDRQSESSRFPGDAKDAKGCTAWVPSPYDPRGGGAEVHCASSSTIFRCHELL